MTTEILSRVINYRFSKQLEKLEKSSGHQYNEIIFCENLVQDIKSKYLLSLDMFKHLNILAPLEKPCPIINDYPEESSPKKLVTYLDLDEELKSIQPDLGDFNRKKSFEKTPKNIKNTESSREINKNRHLNTLSVKKTNILNNDGEKKNNSDKTSYNSNDKKDLKNNNKPNELYNNIFNNQNQSLVKKKSARNYNSLLSSTTTNDKTEDEINKSLKNKFSLTERASGSKSRTKTLARTDVSESKSIIINTLNRMSSSTKDKFLSTKLTAKDSKKNISKDKNKEESLKKFNTSKQNFDNKNKLSINKSDSKKVCINSSEKGIKEKVNHKSKISLLNCDEILANDPFNSNFDEESANRIKIEKTDKFDSPSKNTAIPKVKLSQESILDVKVNKIDLTNTPIPIDEKKLNPKTILTSKTEVVENTINIKKIDKEEIFSSKIEFILKYLNKNDLIKIRILNKNLSNHANQFITSHFTDKISLFEEKLKKLKDRNSMSELTKEVPPFSVARGTIKAIELLNDSNYHKLFIQSSSVPCEETLLPYKIYFQLLQDKILKTLDNDKVFWSECCKYFFKDASVRPGDYINNSVRNFDLSEDNLYLISKFCLNKEKIISPSNFSKKCPTTGLIIFLIRDILEYTGIIVDKKTLPGRLYKLYMFGYLKNKQDLQNFNKIIGRNPNTTNQNLNSTERKSSSISYSIDKIETKQNFQFSGHKLTNSEKIEVEKVKATVASSLIEETNSIQENFIVKPEETLKNMSSSYSQLEQKITQDSKYNTILMTETQSLSINQEIIVKSQIEKLQTTSRSIKDNSIVNTTFNVIDKNLYSSSNSQSKEKNLYFQTEEVSNLQFNGKKELDQKGQINKKCLIDQRAISKGTGDKNILSNHDFIWSFINKNQSK